MKDKQTEVKVNVTITEEADCELSIAARRARLTKTQFMRDVLEQFASKLSKKSNASHEVVNL